MEITACLKDLFALQVAIPLLQTCVVQQICFVTMDMIQTDVGWVTLVCLKEQCVHQSNQMTSMLF